MTSHIFHHRDLLTDKKMAKKYFKKVSIYKGGNSAYVDQRIPAQIDHQKTTH